jgi:chemotaxis protein methyltransferase CheR
MDLMIKDIREIGIVLHQKTGVDISLWAGTSCKRRLIKAMEILFVKNADDLKIKMQNTNFANSFLTNLIVDQTEYFRDVPMWRKLKTEILPKFASNIKISVLFTGVSSGEDLFTFLIILKQLNLLSKLDLIATECTQEALDNLNKRVFSEKEMEISIKNFERFEVEGDFSKYFEIINGNWQIHKSFLSTFKTKVDNIENTTISGKFDLVFCRNHMIYFNPSAKDKILNNLDELVKTGGVLLLGVKEKLNDQMDKKYHEIVMDESIYIKK